MQPFAYPLIVIAVLLLFLLGACVGRLLLPKLREAEGLEPYGDVPNLPHGLRR